MAQLLRGDSGQLLAHVAGPPNADVSGAHWIDTDRRPALIFSADEQLLLTTDTDPPLAWPLSAEAILQFADEHQLPSPIHRFSADELRRLGIDAQ